MDKEQHPSGGKMRSSRSGRRMTPDRHWTLMFIGDHGKVVSFKHFKGLVIAGIIALLMALAAAAGLLYFNLTLARDNRQLKAGLKSLRKQMGILRHENEILMAKLVLAQADKSRKQAAQVDRREDDRPTRSPMVQSPEVEPEKTLEKTLIRKEPIITAARPRPVEPRPVPKQKPQLRVAIENFKIFPISANQNLRIQFKLKNTSENSQRVSGYAIVVLKGDQLEPARWISIPQVPLVAGRPTGRRRGYAFGINYFRTMRITARAPLFPEKYNRASVYVFTRTGDLLLEQDFAVRLKPAPRKTVQPPAPDGLLRKSRSAPQE